MRTIFLATILSLIVQEAATAQRISQGFASMPHPVLTTAPKLGSTSDTANPARIFYGSTFRPTLEELQQTPCDESRIHGRSDAGSRHGTSGWFLGGVGSGLLLGLIGAGIITGAAASSNPQPVTIPSGFEQACYREGYSGKAKSKNTVSALTGGLVGTAALVIIYVSATSN